MDLKIALMRERCEMYIEELYTQIQKAEELIQLYAESGQVTDPEELTSYKYRLNKSKENYKQAIEYLNNLT